MAEHRWFKVVNRELAGWSGAGKDVKIYRHRGTWAFYDGDGFMWCRESGFRSPLAAVRAAAKWLGDGFKLTRKTRVRLGT